MLTVNSLLAYSLSVVIAYFVYCSSHAAVERWRLERYVIYANLLILQSERGVVFLDAERNDLERRIDELKNSVIHGDCLEVMSKMPESSVDAVVTDPPYGIQGDGKVSKRQGSAAELGDSPDWENEKEGKRFEWLGRVLKEFHRVLKPAGNLGLFYDRFEITRLRNLGEAAGFHALNSYCMRKKNSPPHFRKDNFKSAFELAVLFCVDKRESKFNYLDDDPRAMENFHEYIPSDRETKHPTEKPVKPFEDWIRVLTDEGNLVLDPFCGSGAVLKAAQRTGQEWIGIEKNPEYAEMSEERLNANYRKLNEFCESDRAEGGEEDDPTCFSDLKRESVSEKDPSGGKKEGPRPKKSTIQLPPRLVEQARSIGIDVPNYCKNSLVKGVKALKGVGFSGDTSTPAGFDSPTSQVVLDKRPGESTRVREKTRDGIIKSFKDFCEVDLDLADSTIQRHLVVVRDFLDYFDDLNSLTREKIRGYLKKRKRNEAKATYANRIKALRRFLRDFLKKPELIEGFKIPQQKANHTDTNIVDKGDLQKFYKYIDSVKYEAIFLFKGSSGLRISEVTGLTVDDVVFEKRMIIPHHDSTTKKSYVTFYNSEAEEKLQEFMPERKEGDDRLFQTNDRTVQKSFRRTSKRAGIRITPKMLREWFAKEMRNLNVSGEHIDAFCGRLPKNVRGKHYTDFTKERLKEVYEEADIRILD